MNPKFRALARDLLPPALYQATALAVHRSRETGLVFSGDYATWAEAAAASEGYADNRILERAALAMTEVMAGRAIFERDSVLLPEAEYSFPALTALLWLAGKQGGSLDVVDFGGALGSSYFQFRPFLSHLASLRWTVVEQPEFVRYGREKISAPGLSFHLSLGEAAAAASSRLFFASSVVQYLPDPAALLDEAIQRFDYLLFDRTAFHRGSGDRLTRQQNPKSLYRASYPAWFFNEEKFLTRFTATHELVYAFDGRDRVWLAGGQPYYRGFLFKRRLPS